MAVTLAEVVLRVRELLAEYSDDFWSDTRIGEQYHAGAELQHERIFANAEAWDLVLPPEKRFLATAQHPYLKFFLKTGDDLTEDGVSDYPAPSDLMRWKDVYLGQDGATVNNAARFPAKRVHYDDDILIRSFPQLGPSPRQPFWTVTSGGKLRLYTYGHGCMPRVAGIQIAMNYYRLINRVTSSNVDLPDPWNEGPIRFAVAASLDKERSEESAAVHRAICTAKADAILPPPPAPGAA